MTMSKKKSKFKGDKPLMDTRMDAFAADTFPDPDRKKLIYMGDGGLNEESSQKDVKFNTDPGKWDEHNAEINEYNDRIRELDEDYASFIPHKELVVRAFHKSYEKSKDGMIISEPKVWVPLRTANGLGNITTMASPWAFKNLAVVVSVPEGYEKYKPGDIVQVFWGVVLPQPKQKFDDDRDVLPNAFTLYSYQEVTPPKNIKDKHFGYFMVDPYKGIMGKPGNLNK